MTSNYTAEPERIDLSIVSALHHSYHGVHNAVA